MKPSWPKAAQVLASGGTATAAAAAAGVDPRTIRRWRADEIQFADAIEDARSVMLTESAGLLAAESTAAVRRLGEIIKDGRDDHALSAARAVLDMASRYRNDQALEARIFALELAAGLRE